MIRVCLNPPLWLVEDVDEVEEEVVDIALLLVVMEELCDVVEDVLD